MLPFSCGRHGNYCHPPCWSALSHSLPPAPHAASAQPASTAPCRARPGPAHAGEWDLGARTQFWSFPASGGHQPGGRRAGSKLRTPLPPAASPKGRMPPCCSLWRLQLDGNTSAPAARESGNHRVWVKGNLGAHLVWIPAVGTTPVPSLGCPSPHPALATARFGAPTALPGSSHGCRSTEGPAVSLHAPLCLCCPSIQPLPQFPHHIQSLPWPQWHVIWCSGGLGRVRSEVGLGGVGDLFQPS